MAEHILEFRDNGTGHDDVFLTLGKIEGTADAYYLALDRGINDGDESPQKIRLVLQKLLDQWRRVLLSLEDGSSVYLPYDFSDEYTGCLCCRRCGDNVIVMKGYSGVEGWSVMPTDLGNYFTSISDFEASEQPEMTIALKSLVERISQAITVAARSGSRLGGTDSRPE